jgi:hypothetical protein
MEGLKTANGHLKAIAVTNICSSVDLSNELKGDSPPSTDIMVCLGVGIIYRDLGTFTVRLAPFFVLQYTGIIYPMVRYGAPY